MHSVSSDRAPAARSQLMVLGGVFALVVALLGIGYFLFLRTEYVVLVQDLRPADAQAIVAELDKRGTPYSLRDRGTTILVPSAEADATRLAIAGSEAAERGQIGFELFNKSDMGLTNFAQKINYQRALQGELVRTITMEDGVESARVHLALPEKTLFRSDRVEPKAAVTLTMKPGQTADAARVAGIQQLVAAAVPDLPQSKVVVLDSAGRVISPSAPVETGFDRPADLEERSAVSNYYRARARGAIERAVPGLKFVLRVLVLPIDAASAGEVQSVGNETSAVPEWTPSGDGAARNYRLRILFITEAPLGAEDQSIIQNAVAQTAALNSELGDTLSFETGPLDPEPSSLAAAQPAPVAITPANDPVLKASNWEWPSSWIWGPIVLAVLAFVLWRIRPGARARLDDKTHDAFAARLRRELELEDSDAIV